MPHVVVALKLAASRRRVTLLCRSQRPTNTLPEVLKGRRRDLLWRNGSRLLCVFGGFPALQGFAGVGLAGAAASPVGVRSDGMRREGSGLSGDVCVWTIFHSTPTFW
ncbi:MAG: hypothetical protein QOH49_5039 [Acidobacteriota bacterium]|nr:hypothetical protein [Acidobacteriota bacterium]